MKSSLKNITPIIFILSSLVFPKPSLSESVAIHSIITFTGKVTIKKSNWNNEQPASVGFTLKSEDTLIVPVNGSIQVYCSSLETKEFKQGTYQVSDKCPLGKAVIQLPNSNNDRHRGIGQTEEARAKTPYLITPRETNILTTTPQLRWNQVSGATAYNIEIIRAKWKQETNQNEITYSGEPLRERIRYTVTITADNGAKEEEESIGFTIVDKDTREKVLKEVETINQSTLPTEEKKIMLAQLYRSYELYSDAINLLEDLATTNSQQVIIYQSLGETYLEIGLPQFGKRHYEKALDLAQENDNIALQADIKIGLGITHKNLGDREKAIQRLTEAKAIYTELGDNALMEEIDNMINQILEESSQ